MKYVKFAIMLLLSATICSCGDTRKEQEKLSLLEASRQELASAVRDRDELAILMKQLMETTEEIRRQEKIMEVYNAPSTENPDKSKQLLGNLSYIKRVLREKRRQLAELEERLQESNLYGEELKETVAALNRMIDRQNAEMERMRAEMMNFSRQIGVLNQAVDSLNMEVWTVTDERTAAEIMAEELKDELNTCYYITGTKGQLKDARILEGGFLRKSRLMEGEFDRGYFTVSDKRELISLPLRSAKAKLLTNHPSESYRMEPGSDGQVLVITDPERFWQLTNYLVVQTD